MYWFVICNYSLKEQNYNSALILKDIHPVLWAATPTKLYDDIGFKTELLFFSEIPESIALNKDVRKKYNIESF